MNVPLQSEHCVLDDTLRGHGVTLDAGDEWITLTAPVKPKTTWSALLRTNAALSSRWRAVLDQHYRPNLRAELAIGEDESSLFHETLTALVDAKSRPGTPFTPVAADIEQWCRDAGWEFHTRRSGGGAVSLIDAPPEGSVAAFSQEASGLRLSLAFETIDQPSAASIEALSWLILRAGAMTRLARPVLVHDTDGSVTPRFVIDFFSAPTSTLLDRALGALTVVAQLSAAECTALGSETIAREFLARRGDRRAAASAKQTTRG